MDLKIFLCLITVFLVQYVCEAQITTLDPSDLGEADMDVDEGNEGEVII